MANSDASAYLQVRNLYKNFGDFTALKDISLDVYESEFVCFLGPSGCGKTTLLRAIAGLDIQSAGTIEQAGRNISSLPPTERDFGIVFQSYALFPNLSVNRNVAYGLENKGTAKLRPDHKLVFQRQWGEAADRLKGVNYLIRQLVKLAQLAP